MIRRMGWKKQEGAMKTAVTESSIPFRVDRGLRVEYAGKVAKGIGAGENKGVCEKKEDG